MKLSTVAFRWCAFRWCALAVLGMLVGATPQVYAQQAPAEEFFIDRDRGERRVEGKIRSIDAAKGTFVVAATLVTYPSGAPKLYEIPMEMEVALIDKTFLHLRRSEATDLTLDKVPVGAEVVVVGTYEAAEKRWLAVEVAVWTKFEQDKYSLDGYTPAPALPAAPAPPANPEPPVAPEPPVGP